MKMSPRRKFGLVVLAIVIVGLILGVLAIRTQSQLYEITFLVWIALGAILLYQVRCPKCGASLALQGKVGGLPVFAGYANRKCQNCGADLTKPPAE
jgi:ribosomal protein S27AE